MKTKTLLVMVSVYGASMALIGCIAGKLTAPAESGILKAEQALCNFVATTESPATLPEDTLACAGMSGLFKWGLDKVSAPSAGEATGTATAALTIKGTPVAAVYHRGRPLGYTSNLGKAAALNAPAGQAVLDSCPLLADGGTL